MEDNTTDPESTAGKESPALPVTVVPAPESFNEPIMEVHHHPDLHHKKKKLKEYFLEFLMIFLAVTLGFFAESLRENISDGHKEHEYMQSLLNDMRTDSLKMEYTITDNQNKSNRLDSLLITLLMDLSKPANRVLLYQYRSFTGAYSMFKSNDATMLQLKNSGGLRVIKKDHVADSISRYDYEVKIIYAAESLYITATDAAVVGTHEIFDYSVLRDSSYAFTGKLLPLLTNDPKKLKFFYNEVDFEKGATDNYIRNLKSRLPVVKSLISYLKKEYDLK